MIYDISQPVFGCCVYPGDPDPRRNIECSIDNGDLYNLSSFSMGAHNGTHADAPAHFLKGGKTIEQLDLSKFIGPAYVAEQNGTVSAEDAVNIIQKAAEAGTASSKRILIKGNAVVSSEAARVFAESGLYLLGNESQSVGPVDAPMEVHIILLEAEIVLLEGIRLGAVPEGVYQMCCAPLNLNGAEGAPCRAVLWDSEM